MEEKIKRSELQKLESPELLSRNITLYVKRDDLIDPFVSGNKWRKLKYHVLQAKQAGKNGLLTFGGAYSNHLLATAAACHFLGLKSFGIVRGEELDANSNEILQTCNKFGMELLFISREEYAMKNDWEQLSIYKNSYPSFQIVPEGGSSFYGMIGCQEIMKELPAFDHLFLASGTGTTAAGLLMGCIDQTIHAVPVLKNFDLPAEIRKLFSISGIDKESADEYLQNLVRHNEFHFGGYAKHDQLLLDFVREMYLKFDLKLDLVYTAKAFFAMWQSILKDPEMENKTIIFLHTGGIYATEQKATEFKLFI